jgi:hypothetical protein
VVCVIRRSSAIRFGGLQFDASRGGSDEYTLTVLVGARWGRALDPSKISFRCAPTARSFQQINRRYQRYLKGRWLYWEGPTTLPLAGDRGKWLPGITLRASVEFLEHVIVMRDETSESTYLYFRNVALNHQAISCLRNSVHDPAPPRRLRRCMQ